MKDRVRAGRDLSR